MEGAVFGLLPQVLGNCGKLYRQVGQNSSQGKGWDDLEAGGE